MKNLLVVRLSSFGDIVQCLAALSEVKRKFPSCRISFVTKKQFAGIVSMSPYVQDVIAFDKSQGIKGWINLCLSLRKADFDYFYDAHSNIRTFLLKIILLGSTVKRSFIRRKYRVKRILLFKFRLNLFENPFRGMQSFLEPLSPLLGSRSEGLFQEWSFHHINQEKLDASLEFIKNKKFFICSPSAAWPMKRWPVQRWVELIKIMSDYRVIILGGPTDDYCEELYQAAPDRVINLAGKLSLEESCYMVSKASCFISADTGLIHVAEILGVRGISLIGPSAFGFPSHQTISVIKKDLKCMPCTKDGRGSCSQEVYQKCLVDISAEEVAKAIKEKLE